MLFCLLRGVTKCLIREVVVACTYPFLSIGVGQVVDSLRVPLLPDAEEVGRQESVLSHDHEVHEEPGGRLDHSDLPVGHRDQPVIAAACECMPCCVTASHFIRRSSFVSLER